MKITNSVDSNGTLAVDISRERPDDLTPTIVQRLTLSFEGDVIVSLSLHMHGGAIHTICNADTGEVRKVEW